jgi:hypothetical protein
MLRLWMQGAMPLRPIIALCCGGWCSRGMTIILRLCLCMWLMMFILSLSAWLDICLWPHILTLTCLIIVVHRSPPSNRNNVHMDAMSRYTRERMNAQFSVLFLQYFPLIPVESSWKSSDVASTFAPLDMSSYIIQHALVICVKLKSEI